MRRRYDIKNGKKIINKENSYLGTSVLLSLPYVDIVRCVRFDYMHLVSNLIKSLFQFMINNKSMIFNEDKRKMEELLGRTWNTSEVAPFHISKEFQNIFSKIHNEIKFPLINNNYGRKRDIFSHEMMRSSDYAFYASSYGIWIVNNSNIEEPYKGIICRLIACVCLVRNKSFDPLNFEEMNKFTIETLTLAETLLPYYIFGINFHLLIHTFAREGGLKELGPAISHHTFDQERMGGKLSKLATSFKNPFETIKNHYLLSHIIKFNDLSRDVTIDNFFLNYKTTVALGNIVKHSDITVNINHLLPPYKENKKFINTPGNFYNTIQWKGVKFNTSDNVEFSHVHDNSEVKVLVNSEKFIYEYGTIQEIFIPDKYQDHILVCVKWLIVVPFDEELQIPIDNEDVKNKNSRKRKKNINEIKNKKKKKKFSLG
ncbi:MAG: hypothetical protein M3Y25_10080 [Thermoproteota archaeon]|nr:hypothetical protein [Thermoproteota archaeon]